jgi:hypothetical protein
MSDEEVWKTIPEYPGYEASNKGNIRNAGTKLVSKPYHVPNGYAQVKISLGSRNEFKNCRVHRLIASAWIPNPENKPTVNHKDRNHFNNSVENLEWSTYKEQSEHHAQTTIGKKTKKFSDDIDDLPDEIWKPVPEFEGYRVSNMGRVKTPKDKILMGHRKGTYAEIRIKDGKHYYIHRLVAEAFCEGFDKKKIVNHKDGNRFNNRADNLEWLTQSENILHAHNNDSIKTRVPIIQKSLDGTILREFKSFMEAANITGLCDSSIRWGIKYGGGKHGGFLWERAEKLIEGTVI